MRMHTDETLAVLDILTERLGSRLRYFQQKTCAAFDTRELKREVERRPRRESKGQTGNSTATPITPKVRRPKTFNLQTYKLHALGDYSSSIRKFGTTDSYSTEPVRKYISVTFSNT